MMRFWDDQGAMKVMEMERSDLPASLPVSDGTFKRRTGFTFRCRAALRESARELREVLYCLCERVRNGFSHDMMITRCVSPQTSLRDICLPCLDAGAP